MQLPVYHVFLKGANGPIHVKAADKNGWTRNKDSRRTGDIFLQFIARSWGPRHAHTLNADTISLV